MAVMPVPAEDDPVIAATTFIANTVETSAGNNEFVANFTNT